MRTKKVKDKAFTLQKNLKIKKRAKLMRKESLTTYLFIFILIGGALGLLYFLDTKMTGFAFYEQTSQIDFDEGTYENTEYNGNGIILSENNLIGAYTSKIFDAGNEATWNSLSSSENTPNIKYFYATDNDKDLWRSSDAEFWTETNNVYFDSETYGITSTDNGLFIVTK
ncbi:MAG: hypothetical protein KJ646_01565, partial [Nanoarchaeota archaeon]|nr:hypothetical protein [Nanoarchaeota archaeon]